MNVTTTRLGLSRCPYCAVGIDAASGTRQPKPGDVSICTDCLGILIFKDDLTVRATTGAEEMELAGSPGVEFMRRAAEAIRRKRLPPRVQ